MEENGEVAEGIFREMDEAKRAPVVEEEPRGRKEIKRRVMELSQQKKGMSAEIIKIQEARKLVIIELKQLKVESRGEERTKSPSTPKIELTSEQKQIRFAKNIMISAMDHISHFRDKDDLRNQAYERAIRRMGRTATQTAVEELKAEGLW